jgi:hypothetical protein
MLYGKSFKTPKKNLLVGCHLNQRKVRASLTAQQMVRDKD